MNQILKYIQGTLDFGLWYPHSNDFILFGYTDVDWGGSNDKKSTSGTTFLLGDCLVTWHSKKKRMCYIIYL